MDKTSVIKPSAYKPIEIEIKGKRFKVIEVTRKTQGKIIEFDKKIGGGNLDANYERLEFLIGKQPEIDELTTQEVSDVSNKLINKLYAPNLSDIADETEKNSPGSGNKKSA